MTIEEMRELLNDEATVWKMYNDGALVLLVREYLEAIALPG